MIENSLARKQLAALGEQIRELRAARKFSQVGFAIRAGFARAYYGSIERGERNISAINLIRLARALGVEVGALFPPMSELPQNEAEYDVPPKPNGGLTSSTGHEQGETKEDDLRLVSAGVAARILNVNRRTIERWVHDDTLLPAAKVEDQGGKLYSVFRREDVDQLAKVRRISEQE